MPDYGFSEALSGLFEKKFALSSRSSELPCTRHIFAALMILIPLGRGKASTYHDRASLEIGKCYS